MAFAEDIDETRCYEAGTSLISRRFEGLDLISYISSTESPVILSNLRLPTNHRDFKVGAMTGWFGALFGFGAAQAVVLGTGILECFWLHWLHDLWRISKDSKDAHVTDLFDKSVWQQSEKSCELYV